MTEWLNWTCGNSLRHQYETNILSHFYFLASANTDWGLFFTHLLLCFNPMQKRNAKVSSALRSQYLGDSVILSSWWHHIGTLPKLMLFTFPVKLFSFPIFHQLWTGERMQLWPIMYSSKSTSFAKKSDSLALFPFPNAGSLDYLSSLLAGRSIQKLKTKEHQLVD